MPQKRTGKVQVKETVIPGAFILNFAPAFDSRGYSVRRFCQDTFEKNGLCSQYRIDLTSFNTAKQTLRGMHFQTSPFDETKLVFCPIGAIFDVIVDLREDSSSLGQWFALELNERESTALYIPRGCAHGYMTLLDNTRVDYKISTDYSPQHCQGFRYDDPEIAIKWPLEPAVISERDRLLPLVKDLHCQLR